MTDAPQPIRADDNQIRLNRLTHYWFTLDGQDYRCMVCDANAYGRTADYPCSVEPPRTGDKPLRIPLGKVPYETDGLDEPDPHDWGRTP
jgi:hypothetical protein